MMMAAKKHWIVHYKCVNCMVCELYSIKIVKSESKMANMKIVYYDYIKLFLQNYVQRL